MGARLLFVLFFVTVFMMRPRAEKECAGKEIDLRLPEVIIAEEKGSSLLGATVLGVEFAALPLFNLHIKGDAVTFGNPLHNLRENEPYLQDNVWHFIGAAAATELHYLLLDHYFSISNPKVAAGALSLFFWTIMECFDGFTGAGFSVKDQVSNTMGVAFGIFKLYHPQIPLYIRVGVENWGRLVAFAGSGFDLCAVGTDYYSIFKTEIIYVFENNFYAGIGSIKGRGTGNHDDRYGVTVGYELFRGIEQENDYWWAHSLAYFRRHFILSIGVTYWFDNIKFEL